MYFFLIRSGGSGESSSFLEILNEYTPLYREITPGIFIIRGNDPMRRKLIGGLRDWAKEHGVSVITTQPSNGSVLGWNNDDYFTL